MLVAAFTLEWKISSQDTGKLVREFIKEQNISKTALTDIKFAGGGIFVNKDPVTVRHRLNEDEVLKVVFPHEKPSLELKPENLPIQIVYEDPFMLVVNKPANQQSIPSRESRTGSLANALLHYYQSTGLNATVHLVNRLDRDTSGLLLVAKHRHIHHLLSEQQKAGSLKRTYEAIVHGVLGEDSGTIDAPIGRKDDSIIERQVREGGQRAVTHFRVIQKHSDCTHVQLQLETGRTHQIRVHLSYIGHPIVGDDLYGGMVGEIKRQALHCCELKFLHPMDKKEVVFYAELPDDMKELLEKATF
ncbi:RluA family pseudouridine synthase [Bacillus sp. REN16]|uniref:RluA family pseudouridine synthase n=1 Tax=Bacillus sp. REN16 TaxID=2887296 RepID=UPI001E53870B|nr:RluA family pseudouridine synthase [Bacillus sp. REN16]MCC3355633.1 RluA family pseudouridine synthase [Bacillus sp. REN16]